MQTSNPMGAQPQLDAPNLKVLEDQLNYESIMNKKLDQYAEYCTDSQLKNICRQGAEIHKQNFNNLLNYLNSHQ